MKKISTLLIAVIFTVAGALNAFAGYSQGSTTFDDDAGVFYCYSIRGESLYAFTLSQYGHVLDSVQQDLVFTAIICIKDTRYTERELELVVSEENVKRLDTYHTPSTMINALFSRPDKPFSIKNFTGEGRATFTIAYGGNIVEATLNVTK